jgi:hypothetical protein
MRFSALIRFRWTRVVLLVAAVLHLAGGVADTWLHRHPPATLAVAAEEHPFTPPGEFAACGMCHLAAAVPLAAAPAPVVVLSSDWTVAPLPPKSGHVASPRRPTNARSPPLPA